MRPVRAVAALLLLLSVYTAPAAAQECRFCVDAIVLQTRDGQTWSDGQPITLVLHVTNYGSGAAPASAEAVVMQTDGDRTKCLGVPLKLIQADSASALYAGLFFPFRAARFDGVAVVGADVQNITFDVNRMTGGAGPSGELPEAEKIDTSAPLPPLIALLRRVFAAV